MPKMSIDPRSLSGSTMGTRWSVRLAEAPDSPRDELVSALQQAVSDIDDSMSTWKADSELMRLNRADIDRWHTVSQHLLTVLERGLAIGRASNGAFDIGLGDLVNAWGFGPEAADVEAIQRFLGQLRPPVYDTLEVDRNRLRVRKHTDLNLDLSGIAKGYGVDRLVETLREYGITNALASIDGELRALGRQSNGEPWSIAIERPDPELRAAHSILALADAAVATSGDYRHWVDVGRNRFCHAMQPGRNGPMALEHRSVTVVTDTALEADAWATALLVLGPDNGLEMARKQNLNVLFLSGGETTVGVGPLFG